MLNIDSKAWPHGFSSDLLSGVALGGGGGLSHFSYEVLWLTQKLYACVLGEKVKDHMDVCVKMIKSGVNLSFVWLKGGKYIDVFIQALQLLTDTLAWLLMGIIMK